MGPLAARVVIVHFEEESVSPASTTKRERPQKEGDKRLARCTRPWLHFCVSLPTVEVFMYPRTHRPRPCDTQLGLKQLAMNIEGCRIKIDHVDP